MCCGAGGSILLWTDDQPKGGRDRAGIEHCVLQQRAQASSETGLFQGHTNDLEMVISCEVWT